MRTMSPRRGSFDVVGAPVGPKIDALAHIEWLRPQVVLPVERGRSWPLLLLVPALAAFALAGVATASDPVDDELLATTAFELQQAGRVDEAIGVYRAAIERDPNNTVLHFNLGALHHGRGATGEAVVAYEAALTASPSYVPALFNLGVLRTALADPGAAVQLYRRLLVIEPDHAAANLNLGVLLLERGEQAEGSELIDRAIALDPWLQLP